MGTRTFDLNNAQITGKPIVYYDNKYDIKVGLDIGGEGLLFISVGKDSKDDGSGRKVPVAPFTEEEAKSAGVLTITDAKFSHWIKKSTGQTQYELKTYGKKVLLGVDVGVNSALAAGVVKAVSTDQNKFVIEIPYMSKRGGRGQKAQFSNRLVRVAVEPGKLPSVGDEVLVNGKIVMSKTGTPDLAADAWATI